MKFPVLTITLFSTLLCASITTQADEIEFYCDGTYDSQTTADNLDPSTISVKAHLEATILGDESADGEYTMLKTHLVLIATNFNNKDAGSFNFLGDIKGKINNTDNSKYKNYIRFDLGSKLGDAYSDNGNTPKTFLLLPTDESNTVYVQRSGSGHDAFPTLTLICK
jgi:hypothetical protein